MSRPDPTTEYVRTALQEAAQAYQPERTGMVNRVAAGRVAPQRRRRSFLGMHPVGAAIAVAAVLTASVVAVESATDHDRPAATPPVAAARLTAPATPLPSPAEGHAQLPPAEFTAGKTRSSFLSSDGALDAHSVATWSQQNVTITNTKALATLRVTIRVARTKGTASVGHYTTVPNSDLTMTVTADATALTYSYVLREGKKLIPGKYIFAAQFRHRSGRTADQDAYAVVARTAGTDADLAGTFH